MPVPAMTSFDQVLDLEPHGPDVWVGLSDYYPWLRVYGGQVVAQALYAAMQTVEPGHRVHSLHAYFVRAGEAEEPIRFEVDRLRNGRSFVTRRVVARQSNGAILNLSASFHVEEDAPDVEAVAPVKGLPGPDDCARRDWGGLLERRPVPGLDDERARVWLKVRGPLGDDPLRQAAALAYATDDIPMEAVQVTHPRGPWEGSFDGSEADPYMAASLDHAVWFHRPAPADEWMLHDVRSIGVYGARGLSLGEVYSESGTHVATIAQEVLLREMDLR